MRVRGRGARSRTIEMFVDSGAVYSLLPESDWRALGLKPERTMSFSLADGTTIQRKVSECRFAYRNTEATSPVILGEEADVALLGAVTLETLALVLDPFNRTLYPARLTLAEMRLQHRTGHGCHAIG